MPSCEHFCCQDCAKNFFTLVSGETLLFIALVYSCSMFVLVLTFPIIFSTGCHRPKHQPGSLSFLQVPIDITYQSDIIEIIHAPNTLNLSSSSPSQLIYIYTMFSGNRPTLPTMTTQPLRTMPSLISCSNQFWIR